MLNLVVDFSFFICLFAYYSFYSIFFIILFMSIYVYIPIPFLLIFIFYYPYYCSYKLTPIAYLCSLFKLELIFSLIFFIRDKLAFTNFFLLLGLLLSLLANRLIFYPACLFNTPVTYTALFVNYRRFVFGVNIFLKMVGYYCYLFYAFSLSFSLNYLHLLMAKLESFNEWYLFSINNYLLSFLLL
jgi:hypothetical protein